MAVSCQGSSMDSTSQTLIKNLNRNASILHTKCSSAHSEGLLLGQVLYVTIIRKLHSYSVKTE